MELAKVEKKSHLYALLYKYTKFMHDNMFYRKVVYSGIENIPKNAPVLIAPNHQNALMDALAILFAQDSQMVFLARSDIFKSKLISKILFFFKILPVFRIRDGKEKLKLNDLVFAKTVEIMEKNGRIAIFPEAQHTDKRHLRKLKKGIQRVGFMTEEKNNYTMNIHVIPAGIYYSNYWNFRSVLHVNFGKAILFSDYYDSYKENSAGTIIDFGNHLTEEIKKLMIDIRDTEHYDTYETLREMYGVPMIKKLGNTKLSQKNKFEADKKNIKAIEDFAGNNPEEFKELDNKVNKYSSLLKKFNLRDWVLEKSTSKLNIFLHAIILLLGLPVFVYGAANNIVPYFLPRKITRKIKDKQFVSSIVFSLGIFSFPIIYLVLFGLFWIFSGIWWLALIYLITLPITGLLSFIYSRLFVKFLSKIKFSFNKNKAEIQELISLRKDIIKKMDKITSILGHY